VGLVSDGRAQASRDVSETDTILRRNTHKTRHGGDFKGKPAPLRQTTKSEDIRFFQDVQPVFCRKKCARPSPRSGFSTSEAKARSFNSAAIKVARIAAYGNYRRFVVKSRSRLKRWRATETLRRASPAVSRLPPLPDGGIINGEIQQCRF
jgi:hypothetical protein